MNNTTETTIREIAQKVRVWAENKAHNSNGRYPPNLMGLCAISSARLHMELENKSIDATLNLADGHVFVMVDDYIVDVTATQFSEFSDTKINIIHERMVSDQYYYDVRQKFKTRLQLVREQSRQNWPDDEIAHAHKLK